MLPNKSRIYFMTYVTVQLSTPVSSLIFGMRTDYARADWVWLMMVRLMWLYSWKFEIDRLWWIMFYEIWAVVPVLLSPRSYGWTRRT